MPPPTRPRLSEIAITVLVGLPVVMVCLGGVYSLPAMRLTRERDPWLTLLLALGLALTVFGIGLLAHTALLHSACAWGASLVVLLLARTFYGSLGHNLERFGGVHLLALTISLVAAAATRYAMRHAAH